MRNFLLASFFSVFLLIIFLGQEAQASESVLYYVLAPKSSFKINDEVVENSSSVFAKMIFRKKDKEKIAVGADSRGLRIMNPFYQIDVKNDSMVRIEERVILDSGSLHVISRNEKKRTSEIVMGNIMIRFQDAEFLLFSSGDQLERLIKVLNGEVEMENPKSRQKMIVKANEASGVDPNDRLLLNFSFEKKDMKSWWKEKAYQSFYSMLPIADSGDDQRVLGNIPVMLDGSQSEYLTGDIFEWILVKGPLDDHEKEITEVSFDSTNIVKPLFTPLIDGEYVFTLQITDAKGQKSNTDTVAVFVGKKYLQPLLIFSDVPLDHPNNLAIVYLSKKNVMKGIEEKGTGKILFSPSNPVNRAEIIKTVFENKRQQIPTSEELQTELKKNPSEFFIDVRPEHWFAPYVYKAKKMGIIKGNKGFYRPADDVLRAEGLKIVLEAYQIKTDAFQKMKEGPYNDVPLQAWYAPFFFFVKKYNLLDSNEQGNISPDKPLARAELAELLYRMESIHLTEKRGFLQGVLKEKETKKGVPNAEIYIYQAREQAQSSKTTNAPFVERGNLYSKTLTQNDGTFSVYLPLSQKYYIEAIVQDDISNNKIVTSLSENETTTIELEISLGKNN